MLDHPLDAWPLAPESLALGADEVHVWRFALTVPLGYARALRGVLSPDELQRAAHYRLDRDRTRFVAARGILRFIMAGYLGTEPRAIRFRQTEHGKPELAGSSQPAVTDKATERDICGRLGFNLSHSEDLALVALARGRRLGIDVERVRPDALEDGLLAQVCSPQELRTWRSLDSASRQLAFYTCWTRKEAYLKARGEGLVLDLSAVTVSLTPGDLPALLRVEGEPDEARRWSLLDLSPASGLASALAVEGIGWSLRRWSWSIFR